MVVKNYNNTIAKTVPFLLMCVLVVFLFAVVLGFSIVLMFIVRETLSPVATAAIRVAVYKTAA